MIIGSTLLLQMGALYGKDTLGLELAMDYWYPTESSQQTGFSAINSMYRPPQRQVSAHTDFYSVALYIVWIMKRKTNLN